MVPPYYFGFALFRGAQLLTIPVRRVSRCSAKSKTMLAPMIVKINPITMMIGAQLMTWIVTMARIATTAVPGKALLRPWITLAVLSSERVAAVSPRRWISRSL
jgi:hypothetical protein